MEPPQHNDILKASSVFVPGGVPTITYAAREGLGLESQVADYLDERHKILSISGPTKCGKTVLLRSVISDAVWLSGGNVESVDDFWDGICERFDLPAEIDTSESSGSEEGKASALEAGAKPFGLGLSGTRQDSTSKSSGHTRSEKRVRSSRAAAQATLRDSSRTLIVDDFHYIPPEVQLAVVRALKELIFDGVPVIFASVPHRAYDVIRVEKEMTGRIEQLHIPAWQLGELSSIAVEGFQALNLEASTETTRRPASESFGSPFLMQEFCLQICKRHGLRYRQEQHRRIPEFTSSQWEAFFRERAPIASKAAFDLLARGPRQRTDRKKRLRVDGLELDIYGIVISALAGLMPATALKYEDIRTKLREVMADDVPQRHEITRVLDEMTKIARDKIEGEPVLEYDGEMSTLHISDPFFAYFLRWGYME